MAAAVEVGKTVTAGMTRARVAFLAALIWPAVLPAANYAVVIAGLGGEPEYEKRFREQADEIAAANEKVTGDAQHGVALTGERAKRDSVRRELKALAGRMSAGDSVTIMLIGHGSFDGDEYRFNLPGPDLTASELGRLFDDLPARDQLIVNATSASGAAIERWQKPRRVIISATKSGGERTATRFAQHWVKAVTTTEADTNKDEVVTASEAFDYTTKQVAAAFKSDIALATEHARLEGDNASLFTVARLGAVGPLSTDPEVNALLTQRGQIELDLNAVKERRPTLTEDAYYDELEGVLVKLAMLQRQIDARQASAGTQP